jgi:phage host-nuclease inhibitor protein Gam
MIDGFTETQIITGLVAVLIASYAAFFGRLVTSIHGLRRETRETRIELTDRLDAVDAKFTAKIDALTVAISRLEGAVYRGLPEPRRAIQE